jgi:diacylglycerol O-acyltransferase
LLGTYPVSAVFHGFALNITFVSYHGNLDFGIIACRRTVPRVQRLIDYLEQSLTELEEIV